MSPSFSRIRLRFRTVAVSPTFLLRAFATVSFLIVIVSPTIFVFAAFEIALTADGSPSLKPISDAVIVNGVVIFVTTARALNPRKFAYTLLSMWVPSPGIFSSVS